MAAARGNSRAHYACPHKGYVALWLMRSLDWWKATPVLHSLRFPGCARCYVDIYFSDALRAAVRRTTGGACFILHQVVHFDHCSPLTLPRHRSRPRTLSKARLRDCSDSQCVEVSHRPEQSRTRSAAMEMAHDEGGARSRTSTVTDAFRILSGPLSPSSDALCLSPTTVLSI